MRNVWITYDSKDYEINKGFVSMFESSFQRNTDQYRIMLVLTENLTIAVEEGKTYFYYDAIKQEKPAFVISRTRDFRLSRALEREGIRVFNSSFVCEICNDKAITYQEVNRLRIPMPDTWFDHIPEELAFPYICKPVDGHGGIGVSMITNDAEKEEFLLRYGSNHHFVVQRPVSDLGRDVRVYVCGGKIVQAMLRESKTDFRSNFCLGGTASCYTLNPTETEYVKRLQEHFRFDFAGIDFIFDHGKAVFNEIEDVVGSRMLYSMTDIDIVDIYTKYMLDEEGI